MHWNDLWAALALVLIIEGILPFINPGAFKRYLQSMQNLPEANIRWFGLTIMLLGLIALFVIRQ